MLNAVQVGDEIVTAGGIYGEIREVDDDDDVLVRIAPGPRRPRRPPGDRGVVTPRAGGARGRPERAGADEVADTPEP